MQRRRRRRRRRAPFTNQNTCTCATDNVPPARHASHSMRNISIKMMAISRVASAHQHTHSRNVSARKGEFILDTGRVTTPLAAVASLLSQLDCECELKRSHRNEISTPLRSPAPASYRCKVSHARGFFTSYFASVCVYVRECVYAEPNDLFQTGSALVPLTFVLLLALLMRATSTCTRWRLMAAAFVSPHFWFAS